jgi:citrate lyase beta subunit
MRHFDFLTESQRAQLFRRPPVAFDPASAEPELLAAALGATLYLPATRPTLAQDIVRRAALGVTSVVVCLEDAIGDADVHRAEANLAEQLRHSARGPGRLPMIFVRVRAPAQVAAVLDSLGDRAEVVTGFVLPKFSAELGPAFLDEVVKAADRLGRRLFAMPVLESSEMAYLETRREALLQARAVVDAYRGCILALRVGATDLLSAFGLRRSRELSVYAVRLVADVIADIVNVFARSDDGYVVTGPVWEHFGRAERLFKPQLRESPFVRHADAQLRAHILDAGLDGLIREVELDRANGLLGKSVIHPTHVAPIHALSVVTSEECTDADDILATGHRGGASRSAYRNKMNESKPHTAWARRTALRAQAFGVARDGVSFVDLLDAGRQGE